MGRSPWAWRTSAMSRLRSLAQLVRLPNVFTALADIGLGALVVGALPERWLAFLLLLWASACLYCAGMVWNDFFDVAQDSRERPFRPIPSGRVSRRQAALLGGILLAAGVSFALLAGWALPAWSSVPAVLAVLLVVAILSYDGLLKRTPAAPLLMGTCRFLNVLLGLSLAGSLDWGRGIYLALVVGVYIVGVTWFARTEARASSRLRLAGGAAVMLAGLLLALPVPAVLAGGPWRVQTSVLFPFLLVAFGFLVGLPVCRALSEPVPARVQAAVKRSVLGLVVLDAVLATAGPGTVGLLLLLLLPPALVLGKRLYST
jgi:4-hydroxybenzoate polyprenyltransferase